MAVAQLKNRVMQRGLCFFCLTLFLLLMAGAWSLVFFYPSQSLFYKFGIQKLMLRSGKLIGITGGLLILAQLLAISRLPFLDWIFTRNGLLRLHRINGPALFLLISHPILILWANDFAFYTLEKKYLPEFLGVALLICLFLLVLTAQFRLRLPLSYPAWRWTHRFGALLVVGLFLAHLLTVSETFRTGLPYKLALGLALVECSIVLIVFGRAFFTGKKG